MRANKRFLVALGVIGVWTVLTYFIVIKNHDYQQSGSVAKNIHEKVVFLENEIRKETDDRKEIISRYQNLVRILSATTALPLSNNNNNIIENLENNDVLELETSNANEVLLNTKINFNGKYIDNDVNKPVIPVLVISCNRVSISRSLDLLIKYRPNREQFPIVVSQVCFTLVFSTHSSNT